MHFVRSAAWAILSAGFAASICGCDVAPPPEASDEAGIAGVVMVGPQCPAVNADSSADCADKPLAATVVVRRTSCGCEYTRFTSAADGTFRVVLLPGSYRLDPLPAGDVGLPAAPSQSVEVVAGQFVDITIRYDTGIR
jgi:hypothetical protein